MKIFSAVMFILAAGLFAPVPVHAQDLFNGQRIAKVWCSNCHVVDAREHKTGSDVVPSFQSIARMESTTEMSLEAFLRTTHGRMPNFELTQTEIHDVVAYILTLRK